MTECPSCGTTIDDYIVTVDVVEDRHAIGKVAGNIRKIDPKGGFGLKSGYFPNEDGERSLPLSLRLMCDMGHYYNRTGDPKRGIAEGFDERKLDSILRPVFINLSKASEWYTDDYPPNESKALQIFRIEIIKVFEQNLDEIEMIRNDFNSVKKEYDKTQHLGMNSLLNTGYINKFCPNCGVSISKFIAFNFSSNQRTSNVPPFRMNTGNTPDWYRPEEIPGYLPNERVHRNPFFVLGDINDAIDNLNVALQDNSTEYIASLDEITERAEDIMAQILENYKVAKAIDDKKENEIKELEERLSEYEERLSKLKGGS